MHVSVRLMMMAALVWVAAALPARAITLLRDSEIEYALGELASPILRAAGLSPGNVRIIVIQDRSLNAFVIDSRAIYLHSGLLLKLESAAQVQAIIAHEAAHIANGHLARRMINARNARTAMGLGLALGAAVAAGSGETGAAAAVSMGAQSSAQRVFFGHTRAEEAAADQSAIRYMVRAGVNPRASVEVLQIFRGQEALSVGRQDPYVRSHPLTRDRLRAVEGLAAANPLDVKNETADYWFARAQGKLSAFIQNPSWTLRRTRGKSDQISLMRQAVAHHRIPNPKEAATYINALVAARPNDPFVHELKGQILLESRQAAAAAQAYARAVQLAPNDALILAGHGRALLAQDTSRSNAEALRVLQRARDRDFRSPIMLRDLGLAYARAGRPGEASLAVAERYALRGRLRDAAVHARRAAGQLPAGSASWQRAQDVLFAAERAAARR